MRHHVVIEALNNVKNVLIGLLLIILAIFLIILLVIPAFIWKVYVSITKENRKARDIMTGTAKFFEAIAVSIDVFGGVAFSGLFNNLLLVNQIYKFGDPHETISEVLGWAQYYNDLTKTGKVLVAILDWVDKDHCEKTRVHGIILANKKLNQKKL